MRTALIAGATGLVGGELVSKLQASGVFNNVIVLSRKPVPAVGNCEVKVVDFNRLEEALQGLHVTDIFCCLGTTIRVAKTKEAFKKVDYEYPLALAKTGRELGAQHYYLVSALGADKTSSVFYNRVKGEVEQAITSVGFDAFHIFRPSLLLGNRTEKRSGEDAAKIFFRWFGFLVPNRFKAIHASKVADAMILAAQQPGRGVVIHESNEMQEA